MSFVNINTDFINWQPLDSLAGPTGAPGPQGIPGNTGARGPTGAPGVVSTTLNIFQVDMSTLTNYDILTGPTSAYNFSNFQTSNTTITLPSDSPIGTQIIIMCYDNDGGPNSSLYVQTLVGASTTIVNGSPIRGGVVLNPSGSELYYYVVCIFIGESFSSGAGWCTSLVGNA